MNKDFDEIIYDMSGMMRKLDLQYVLWKLSIIEESDEEPQLVSHIAMKFMNEMLKINVDHLMTDLERSMFDYDG
jgi:hypothetical protein